MRERLQQFEGLVVDRSVVQIETSEIFERRDDCDAGVARARAKQFQPFQACERTQMLESFVREPGMIERKLLQTCERFQVLQTLVANISAAQVERLQPRKLVEVFQSVICYIS